MQKISSFLIFMCSSIAHISKDFSWQYFFRLIVWNPLLLLISVHTPPPWKSFLQKPEANVYKSKENFIISELVKWCSVRQMRSAQCDSSTSLCLIHHFCWLHFEYLTVNYNTAISRKPITICQFHKNRLFWFRTSPLWFRSSTCSCPVF